MFRLLGFLIGSITSVLVILLLVGMPNFHFDDRRADQLRYDEAIEKLRAKQQEFESVADRLSEDVQRVAREVSEPAPVVEQAAGADAAGDPVEPSLPAPDATTAAPPQASAAATAVDEAAESLWYSFWNPFRSEIAANGFVTRLERVTGLDYRVVKVKTGVYEVAFEYRDDEERHAKLERIARATGLDLPDS